MNDTVPATLLSGNNQKLKKERFRSFVYHGWVRDDGLGGYSFEKEDPGAVEGLVRRFTIIIRCRTMRNGRLMLEYVQVDTPVQEPPVLTIFA